MKKTSKMVYIGLLVAQALVLHIFERMIPVPFITPGAKLGLANLIIVIALYTLDSKRDAFLVLFLRLLLSTMFGGNLSSFMYSAAGGILSFMAMVIVKELFKDKVSIIGVSSAGAIFHNVGQLIIASSIVKNIGVMLYLPVLSTIGIGTGIFIGITANYAVNHLKRLPMFKGYI
ncbi:Gx transporter family protein [Clostridium sartagoforme]|uniref:Gx transporter family protein n=1 Tax=Clostridium sartagoforme TaxID=84031 RepID=A0A4S2DGK0_9CLOT|nr:MULTISPECIES: Gx transporter family protein [Clostridium]MBS5939828.1 Gx transporter family protein [Clostridium sp.]TGY40622.1 Gx transporter family protein [Clostridium sartagoforme]